MELELWIPFCSRWFLKQRLQHFTTSSSTLKTVSEIHSPKCTRAMSEPIVFSNFFKFQKPSLLSWLFSYIWCPSWVRGKLGSVKFWKLQLKSLLIMKLKLMVTTEATFRHCHNCSSSHHICSVAHGQCFQLQDMKMSQICYLGVGGFKLLS